MHSGEVQGRRLLLVVNVGWMFLSHRLPIALAAKQSGYEVHVACGTESSREESAIRSHGIEFHRLSIRRGSRSVMQELQLVRELASLYRRLRPDVIHHVSPKPVLYGGFLARLLSDGVVVHAISGLGYIFTETGVGGAIGRTLARLAYRAALSGPRTWVIFQNPDDLRDFVKRKLVRQGSAVLIRGSGVDLDKFRPAPEPPGLVTVVLPARMLGHKGVFEFIAAAGLLRTRGVSARFVLAGGVDLENPTAISGEDLTRVSREQGVEWLGHRSDIHEVLAASHIVCLPSYREGLPKSLLEAAASGRPIVTTDVPGCREAVIDGDTGMLVPPRDSLALANALEKLIMDRDLRIRMGRRARQVCEEQFGIDSVVTRTLKLYEQDDRRS